jgi:p21-activated kinase 1
MKICNILMIQGMPDPWKKLLQAASISKTEQKKDPQALLDALNYYEATSKTGQQTKFMQMKSGMHLSR